MFESVRRLPVHQAVVAFILDVDRLVADLPRERWYLRDQIRRAVLSVLLNLREGAAEMKPAEKARFYRISKRSAAETAAALEMLGLFIPVLLPETERLQAHARLITIELHRLAAEWSKRADSE